MNPYLVALSYSLNDPMPWFKPHQTGRSISEVLYQYLLAKCEISRYSPFSIVFVMNYPFG